MSAVNPRLAAAIAAKGVPLSADMARLTPEREAEIRELCRGAARMAPRGWMATAQELLAELAAVRKERDSARAALRGAAGLRIGGDPVTAPIGLCAVCGQPIVRFACDLTGGGWMHDLPGDDPNAGADHAAEEAAAEPKPDRTARLYATPDHRVWLLSRTYIDVNGSEWSWDQHPYDLVAGPEMVSPSFPFLHLPLLGLAAHCGLHSDTTAAMAAGELALQDHDAAEAGYNPAPKEKVS